MNSCISVWSTICKDYSTDPQRGSPSMWHEAKYLNVKTYTGIVGLQGTKSVTAKRIVSLRSEEE